LSSAGTVSEPTILICTPIRRVAGARYEC